MGIDDAEFATLLPVPLTTLRQPTRSIGETALALMLERIGRPDMPPRDTRLDGDLSCEIPAVLRSRLRTIDMIPIAPPQNQEISLRGEFCRARCEDSRSDSFRKNSREIDMPRKPARMQSLPLGRVYRLLEPGPVVLVTTARKGRANVMTQSWHTMLDFEPPLVGT